MNTVHADIIERCLRAHFPGTHRISRTDYQTLVGQPPTSVVQVYIPVTLDGVKSPRTFLLSFNVDPSKDTVTVQGCARKATLKLGGDLAFEKKVVAKISDHVEHMRADMATELARDQAREAAEKRRDALSVEFPLSTDIGLTFVAGDLTIRPWSGARKGCAFGELRRVALAAIEAHLQGKLDAEAADEAIRDQRMADYAAEHAKKAS